MKKFLSLVTGIAAVLTFAVALAGETLPGAKDTSDKMVLDDDFLLYKFDHDKAVPDQVPVEPGVEGTAPGGVRNDAEQGKTPADTTIEKVPGESGTGPGDVGTIPDKYDY